MAITFSDTWRNLKAMAFYSASANTYTQIGSSNNVYNCNMFPETGIGDNDAIVFFVDYTYGKSSQIKLNIDIPLSGENITGVWEYSNGLTTIYFPTWRTLTGVTDNTSGLTQTGINTIIFDPPEDWSNYNSPQGTNSIYYNFLLRYRLSGFTTIYEGGHLANVSNSSKSLPFTIYVNGYTSTTPCVFNDIYNASLINGWNVVTKNNNQYSLRCNLYSYPNNYISTKNEQIQLETNYFMGGGGVFQMGEIYSGDKTRYGTSLIFLGKTVNYPSNLGFGSGSYFYNSQVRNVAIGPTVQGHWGGIGTTKHSIIDLYIEGFRNHTFSTEYGVLGVKFQNHIEGAGAIIANCQSYSGNYGWRLNTDGQYIHGCDFSKVTLSPLNPYYYNADNRTNYCVDCDFGTFPYSQYSQWSSGSGTNNKIYCTLSLVLKIIDVNGIGISDVFVQIINNTGTTVFTGYTQIDGYVGQDNGTTTSATTSLIMDSSKTWTVNQYRFKEIFITSGNGIGQRRYIPIQSTTPYNALPLVPNFQVTPVAGDRFIIIPYINWLLVEPLIEETTATIWSKYTEYNPFTILISKAGYESYSAIIFMKEKTVSTITLKPIKNIRMSLDGEVYKALQPEQGSNSTLIKI